MEIAHPQIATSHPTDDDAFEPIAFPGYTQPCPIKDKEYDIERYGRMRGPLLTINGDISVPNDEKAMGTWRATLRYADHVFGADITDTVILDALLRHHEHFPYFEILGDLERWRRGKAWKKPLSDSYLRACWGKKALVPKGAHLAQKIRACWYPFVESLRIRHLSQTNRFIYYDSTANRYVVDPNAADIQGHFREFVHAEMGHIIGVSNQKDLLHFIQTEVHMLDDDLDKVSVSFQDKTWTPTEGLIAPTPDVITLRHIDINVAPLLDTRLSDACPTFTHYLRGLGFSDDETFRYLWTLQQLCRNQLVSQRKALFLQGDTGTGKSTIIDIIATAFGVQEVTAIQYGQFSNRWLLGQVTGNSLIVADEIEKKFINQAEWSTIKQLTGDAVGDTEKKFRDRCTGRLQASMVLASNELFVLPDSVRRFPLSRFIIFQFDQRHATDPTFKERIRQEAPTIVAHLILASWSLHAAPTRQWPDTWTATTEAEFVDEWIRRADPFEEPLAQFLTVDHTIRLRSGTLLTEPPPFVYESDILYYLSRWCTYHDRTFDPTSVWTSKALKRWRTAYNIRKKRRADDYIWEGCYLKAEWESLPCMQPRRAEGGNEK